MIIDIECPLCRGEGTVLDLYPSLDEIDCPRCGGSGAVAHDLNEDCDDE